MCVCVCVCVCLISGCIVRKSTVIKMSVFESAENVRTALSVFRKADRVMSVRLIS